MASDILADAYIEKLIERGELPQSAYGGGGGSWDGSTVALAVLAVAVVGGIGYYALVVGKEAR
jgi:hypothetical protein